MFDIVLEVLRALILLGILVFFLRVDKDIEYGRKGWLYIKVGFLLILFGAFVDITDNFESLNWVVVLGDTPIQAFLEKVVGYLGGFTMLAIGFWLWLPSIREMAEMRQQLSDSKRHLEEEVHERTKTLEEEIESRRKVEASLRQAEERRQMLYENAPVSITHGLIGGSLIDRNMAFAQMLGYDSPEELRKINQGLHIWHDQDDLIRLIEYLRNEKHVRNFETRFLHKDGSIVWVRMDFTTLADRNGVNYYFYGFATDITEGKLAADELAASEHRLKMVLGALSAGVFLVEIPSQVIIDVNPAALEMTGYDYDELVGSHCCDNLCPKIKGQCPLIDKGSEVQNSETTIKRKDGTEMAIVKTISRMSMDGRDYHLETFVDISEQKRLEQLKEDVDRIVQHDLKSPIIGVINACTLLLMDAETLSGETREMLEIIQQKGNKVLRMIGMSLTMYKMEAGTYDYMPEKVDFMGVVSRVMTELSEVAQNKGVAVAILLDDDEPKADAVLPTMGMELLYDSMFANLFKNAIEASPFGQSVTIAMESGEFPTVSVSNSGVVPEEMRATFFDKYTSSGKSAGTGLGTYSASLVIRTVGGNIRMEPSDEEDSTTITINLPGVPG